VFLAQYDSMVVERAVSESGTMSYFSAFETVSWLAWLVKLPEQFPTVYFCSSTKPGPGVTPEKMGRLIKTNSDKQKNKTRCVFPFRNL